MSGPDDPVRLKRMLAASTALWQHWGFEPWSWGPLAGVGRRQSFVKDGFLGRIAEYGAWDHIVWESGDPADREALWAECRPRPEIMTQRFLFLTPETWPGRRIKSFWLGFRGYLEFYAYWPDRTRGPDSDLAADLTGLVDLALKPGRTRGQLRRNLVGHRS